MWDVGVVGYFDDGLVFLFFGVFIEFYCCGGVYFFVEVIEEDFEVF